MMQRMMLRVAALLALLAATATSALGSLPASAAAASYTPRFVAGNCGFTLGSGIVAGRDVRCGDLVVPEDRAHPSRTISLAVAIFASPAAHADAVPLIFLQGGPGGAIVADVGSYITAKNRAQVVGDRPLILVDQRGTGLSQPALSCPEVETEQLAYLSQNLTPQRGVALFEAAMAQCRARLAGQGINLAAYTSYANAADIHDLILALGYPQVDVYGVSYGTRVALEIERSFPQHVHRVILDSTVPAQEVLESAVAYDRTRVFATLFAGCVANASCNKAYPHLATTFSNLLTRLNAHPLTFSATDSDTNKTYSVLFKGADFYDFVWQIFYVSPYIKYIPRLIHDVNVGDTKLLAELFGVLGFDFSTNLGVYYSVECAEGLQYTSPAAVTAADRAYPVAVRTANTASDLGDFAICHNWGVPSVAPSQLRPVSSSLPTLILEDEYDPITPASNGALAAATLHDAIQVRFPGLGHGAYLFSGSDCPTTVVQGFLDSGAVNRTCIASMPEPAFV